MLTGTLKGASLCRLQLQDSEENCQTLSLIPAESSGNLGLLYGHQWRTCAGVCRLLCTSCKMWVFAHPMLCILPLFCLVCVLFPLPAFFQLWKMFICPLAFLSPYPPVLPSTVEHSPSCHFPFLILLSPFTLLIVRQTDNFQSFNLTKFRVVSQRWQSVYFYFKGLFVPRFWISTPKHWVEDFLFCLVFFPKGKVIEVVIWVTEVVTKACFWDGRHCLVIQRNPKVDRYLCEDSVWNSSQ